MTVVSDVQHKLNEFALKSDSNMQSLIGYQQKVRKIESCVRLQFDVERFFNMSQ